MRIRFAGAGGQGVVLCGLVFGRAALLDGKNSLQTQAYGSASRGGLTKSDVCIQDEEIYDLVRNETDVLVAFSQEAKDRYTGDLGPEGVLFYESDLVSLGGEPLPRAHGIPATDIAFKRFERKIIANMIMMGFVNERLGIVKPESLIETIEGHVPRGTEKTNVAAFEEGRRLGRLPDPGD